MKRIALLLLTDLAVAVVLCLLCSVLGAVAHRSPDGRQLLMLLAFFAALGFGGALLSQVLSRRLAVGRTGAVVIDQPSSAAQAWLLATVERAARSAGVAVPQVALFPSPVPDAFAVGMTRNSALVAISDGLLKALGQDEIEAVLGHEVSHVANGDMVTLGLLQGVLNTYGIALVRASLAVALPLQVVPGLLAVPLVAWFSRNREFRADAGGAHLAGKRKMVAALEKLRALQSHASLSGGLSPFGIIGGAKSLFATHPALDVRIAVLGGKL